MQVCKIAFPWNGFLSSSSVFFSSFFAIFAAFPITSEVKLIVSLYGSTRLDLWSWLMKYKEGW